MIRSVLTDVWRHFTLVGSVFLAFIVTLTLGVSIGRGIDSERFNMAFYDAVILLPLLAAATVTGGYGIKFIRDSEKGVLPVYGFLITISAIISDGVIIKILRESNDGFTTKGLAGYNSGFTMGATVLVMILFLAVMAKMVDRQPKPKTKKSAEIRSEGLESTGFGGFAFNDE